MVLVQTLVIVIFFFLRSPHGQEDRYLCLTGHTILPTHVLWVQIVIVA